MVKQKNHTARNKTVKEHARGIRKVPNFRYKSMKGVRPLYIFDDGRSDNDSFFEE